MNLNRSLMVQCWNQDHMHFQDTLEMMTPKIEDFGLSPLRITTYYNEEILQLNLNDTSLNWHIHSSPFYGKCYTLTLSSEITRLGIKQITIEANHKKQFGVFFHTFGSASDSWDIRMPGFLAKSSSRQAVEITHEFIQLLDYDGEKCNNEIFYNQALCLDSKIYSVST